GYMSTHFRPSAKQCAAEFLTLFGQPRKVSVGQPADGVLLGEHTRQNTVLFRRGLTLTPECGLVYGWIRVGILDER
ncbi:MAG: hypothetical protein K6T83_12675, partial [Alicyclobacillus sp.]|nr:hypothetical protein [Alicyclobacillus sp.]